MAAFRSVGAATSVASGNLASVALPAGHVLNDILILVVTQGDNIVSTVPAGWTNKYAANNGVNQRLSVWWKRDNGAEAAPTVTHALGDSAVAFIAAYSGAVVFGSDPFRDFQSQTATVTLTCTAPIVTNFIKGDVQIFIGSFGATDTSGAAPPNWTTVTSFAKRNDVQASLGNKAANTTLQDLTSNSTPTALTSTITWGGAANPNNIGLQLVLANHTQTILNDYQFVQVGDGMSTSEKIR